MSLSRIMQEQLSSAATYPPQLSMLSSKNNLCLVAGIRRDH
jgi:hypothetical protein